MAFSFDTFAKDQKQSAIDVVDTITPSQVKQVGAAYKAGLNASPKQVINETLESFTGVDLSQGAGVDGLGAQAKNFIEGQAASLTMQLEQQVLGCINTAIRDLMNKVPALDFILNFEDRINGILGKFRNKLEQKIDAELRKLTYEKIKVHQVTLFKQRIRGKIKDICPAATPASVAEVQDFNNKIKGFISKRGMDNTAIDTTKTLTTDKINEAKAEVKTQVSTPFVGISNKRKQTFQQDPVETKKIVDEKVAQTTTEVKEETERQLEKGEADSIPALVNDTPTEEDGYYDWYYQWWTDIAWYKAIQKRIVHRILDKFGPSIVTFIKSGPEIQADHPDVLVHIDKLRKDAMLNSHEPDQFATHIEYRSVSYANNIATIQVSLGILKGRTRAPAEITAFPADLIVSFSRKFTGTGDNYVNACYKAGTTAGDYMKDFIKASRRQLAIV